MWKAEIYEVTKKEDGSSDVSVKYTNDQKVVYFTHQIISGGIDSLKKVVKGKIDSLVLQFSPQNDIELGEIDLTPEVVVKPEPTPQDIKRSSFNSKLEDLQKKKRYLDLGLIEAKDISLLQAEIKQLGIELGEI